MSKLPVLLLVVVSLSLATQTYASNCTDTKLRPYEADEAIQLINAARTKAYLGEQKNGLSNTTLPPAAAVTHVNWSCTLEQEAFTILDGECTNNKTATTQRPDATYFRGQKAADTDVKVAHCQIPVVKLLYKKAEEVYACVCYSDLTSVSLPRKIEYWLSEISHNTLNVTDDGRVLYEDKIKLATLGYASLIRITAREVGCARHTCNASATVPTYKTLCITDKKQLVDGEYIYWGNTDPNACQARPYTRDSIRAAFLNKHNNLRSQLALGTVQNGRTRKTCRRAKNMPKLAWDCDLEKAAYDRARQCEKFKPEGTKTLQENSYNLTRRPNRTDEQIAQSVTQLWWSELKVSQGLSQTQNIFYTHLGINRFAKIASDLTTAIGCAMYECGNMVNVVCRYKTTLANAKRLYERGPYCAACRDKCSVGLCPAKENEIVLSPQSYDI